MTCTTQESHYISHQSTFSNVEVSLNVRYKPVVSDENRLPYSLFKKKRYQTGAGIKARYNNRIYSTSVNSCACHPPHNIVSVV
jgi:hypothetical protein